MSDSLKDFSKHSIINLARKAGIKNISDCAITKLKEIINNKINSIAEEISILYLNKETKTVDIQLLLKVLENRKIIYVQ